MILSTKYNGNFDRIREFDSITHKNRFLIPFRLALIAACMAMCLSGQGQNHIETSDEFLSFLEESVEETGIVIVSNHRCGRCLRVMEESFVSDLENFVNIPVSLVDAESPFGIALSIKHRINRLPTLLLINANGQVLKKTREFSVEAHENEDLTMVSDTLPEVENPLDFSTDYPPFFMRSFYRDIYPSDRELNQYFAEHGDVVAPMNWAVIARFEVNDDIMKIVIDSKEELIEKYGADEVFEKFESYLFGKTKTAIKLRDERILYEVEELCFLIYGAKEGKSKASGYESYFYQMTGNWSAFTSVGDQISRENEVDHQRLVSMAGILLASVGDSTLLKRGSDWLGSEPDSMSIRAMEVKAGLFLKIGEPEQARNWARRAIEKAEKASKEAPLAENILEQLR